VRKNCAVPNKSANCPMQYSSSTDCTFSRRALEQSLQARRCTESGQIQLEPAQPARSSVGGTNRELRPFLQQSQHLWGSPVVRNNVECWTAPLLLVTLRTAANIYVHICTRHKQLCGTGRAHGCSVAFLRGGKIWLGSVYLTHGGSGCGDSLSCASLIDYW
jgi:hypothetical protein